MSKEEAYKLIDKLYRVKYTGNITFSFFGGGISNVSMEQTGMQYASQIVLAVSESRVEVG